MWQYFHSFFNRNIQFFVLLVVFCVFTIHSSWSQDKNVYGDISFAEKIYLQLDSNIYTTDETIWFKAIVTNAYDHKPTEMSGVLYVEIIDSDEKIMEKKLLKIENGISNSFFELNLNYTEGTYLIRAYTEWNKNFGSDFFFEDYIQIFPLSEMENVNPIYNIVLQEKQQDERWLKASFDPFMLDSLHKNKLAIYLTLDHKKDTLFIKRNDRNQYEIEYPIKNESQLISLQMKTNNGSSSSKTLVLNEDFLDFQFFPESGDLVHGIQSKVGFKVLDASGHGIFKAGDIVNEKGEILTNFKSNHLGMGSFVLNEVDSTTIYFARLLSKTDDGMNLMYPLPNVVRFGNVLSIEGRDHKIQLKVSSNYLTHDSIFLKVSCRGLDYLEIKGKLKQGILKASLSTKILPEGVLAFTMTDGSGSPLAERLYFNEKNESRIEFNISSDKGIYEQREVTKLSINTLNKKGGAVRSNLSLLVLNKQQLGAMQDRRQNILTYFLLGSDLKGRIENPWFYFSNSTRDKQAHLDALMLTQGWRKYRYTEPIKKMLFQPEKELAISGKVGGILFLKKRKEVALTLLTLGKPKSFQTQITDSLGQFKFDINNEYGKNLEVLIQSENKSGKKKNYSIALNKRQSPDIFFDQIRSVEGIDSTTQVLIEKNMERKWVDEAFQLSEDVNELDEVVLKAYNMTPDRIRVLERYGEADEVITGKAILAKEKKWSYGLYSVLLFNFPDLIEIRNIGQFSYAHVFDAPGMTLVVVDGIPVLEEDYPLIPNIPPSEVSSFEIIKSAKFFVKLYAEVFPEASWEELKDNMHGNVVAIYTDAGKGLHGARKPVGIISAKVPIFSPKRVFYAPKYKNLIDDDWIKQDLRALVHWNPNLMVDTSGHVTDTFYNADNTGEMLVIIEAISDTGAIGYKEFVYEVKKRDSNNNE